MTHPVHHARSSARHYRGKLDDYLPIHHWLDATKSRICDFRHRCFRHHAQGLFWAEEIFGARIVNSDGANVPVRYLGEMHVLEDCRVIPTIDDWIQEMQSPAWWRADISLQAHARASAEMFGGEPSDHLWVHQWFDAPRASTPTLWGFLRHHTEGIFEIEAIKSEYTLSNGRTVDTRPTAEAHIIRTTEKLRPASDWVRRIRRRHWMARPAKVRTIGKNGRPDVLRQGNLTRPAEDAI